MASPNTPEQRYGRENLSPQVSEMCVSPSHSTGWLSEELRLNPEATVVVVFKPRGADEKPAATDSHLSEAIRLLTSLKTSQPISHLLRNFLTSLQVYIFSHSLREGLPGSYNLPAWPSATRIYVVNHPLPFPVISLGSQSDPLKLLFSILHFFFFCST